MTNLSAIAIISFYVSRKLNILCYKGASKCFSLGSNSRISTLAPCQMSCNCCAFINATIIFTSTWLILIYFKFNTCPSLVHYYCIKYKCILLAYYYQTDQFRKIHEKCCPIRINKYIYLIKHYFLHLSWYPTFSFQLLNAVSVKRHSRRRVATLYTCRHIQRRKACINYLGLTYFISSNLNSPSGSSQFLIVRNLFQSLSLP